MADVTAVFCKSYAFAVGYITVLTHC